VGKTGRNNFVLPRMCFQGNARDSQGGYLSKQNCFSRRNGQGTRLLQPKKKISPRCREYVN
jgi:hypothetical protein